MGDGSDPVEDAAVVVVGAGPVGLAAAIDLVQRGVRDLVILDKGQGSVAGSRAICWARRTLEIFGRLGVGRRIAERGVGWSVGRVFRGDRELYRFDLQPEGGYAYPAFVNLSQAEVEAVLVDRLAALGVRVRWGHAVTGLDQTAAGVVLAVDTPGGARRWRGRTVVAADGPHSTIRKLMGLAFEGRAFEERFLIADVRIPTEFPGERRFWFHPTFHRGQSVLLHRQPDRIYRIDFQLGADIDPLVERQPERVAARVRAMLGPDQPFELVWASVYAFQCRRLDRFRHGRVLFAGDSAHQVSPFGARGGNGGIQDADNLAWKLALVLAGRAPDRLLDSYDDERREACAENLMHSTRTTAFMSPRPGMPTALRDAVLDLAPAAPFARGLVNSGRLSRPCSYSRSPLSSGGGGAPCPDAPIRDPSGRPGWLLERLGTGFVLLCRPPFQGLPAALQQLARCPVPVSALTIGADGIDDVDGLVAVRYGLEPGAAVLIRPDGHIAARFDRLDADRVGAALERACGDTATEVAA